MLQQGMKFFLRLEHQLEVVDYGKANFIHADLSPEEMAKAIKDRGDDSLSLTLRIISDVIRQQNMQDQKKKENGKKDEDLDLLSLLVDPAAPVKLKRMMAEQFENAETGLGPTLNTILISDRNAAAVKVLQKEIGNGKKKIAIFYGAAHMPDFEKRLKDDLGLKRDKEEWLPAWDLRMKDNQKGLEDVLKKLLEG